MISGVFSAMVRECMVFVSVEIGSRDLINLSMVSISVNLDKEILKSKPFRNASGRSVFRTSRVGEYVCCYVFNSAGIVKEWVLVRAGMGI